MVEIWFVSLLLLQPMKKISPNLKKIIRILSDGEHHSGSDLGTSTKITRSAIWKFMKVLDSYGVEVESSKSKGYRLPSPIILLDSAAIKKNISSETLKEQLKIEVFATVDSTNQYLKTLKAETKKNFQVCLAEYQTAGRGRFGRKWYSPFGSNIYFSLSWTVSKDVSELNGFSLVVGLAVVKALEACGVPNTLKLKWPNDVQYQQKKLAGILLEINAEANGASQVIIGIGLNVNMADSAEIDQPWVSVRSITKQLSDRNVIIAKLIEQLMQNIRLYETLGLKHFLPEWQVYDALYGKEIQLEQHKQIIKGTMQGIDERGHLLLQDEVGQMNSYSSGDVSIKK